MNYKFKLGELVEVDLGGLLVRATPLLALVIDRITVPDFVSEATHEVYTLLLPDGSKYEEYGDELTKVSENNEL